MENNFECRYLSVGGTFCYYYDQDIGLNDLKCNNCEMNEDCNYCSWSNLVQFEHLCKDCKVKVESDTDAK